MKYENSPLLDKLSEFMQGFVEPTTEAIPRVLGTAAAGMAAMPIAGIGGLSKLITTGDLSQSNSVIENIMNAGNFIKTPQQAQSLEYLNYPMKPMEMAGEGWGLIGKLVDQQLQNAGLEPTYLEPLLGSTGTAAGMFSLPELMKAKNIKLSASPLLNERGSVKIGDMTPKKGTGNIPAKENPMPEAGTETTPKAVGGKEIKEPWQMTREEWAKESLHTYKGKLPLFTKEKIENIASAIDTFDLDVHDPRHIFPNGFDKIFKDNTPLTEEQWGMVGNDFLYDQVWREYLDRIGAVGYWSSLQSQGTKRAIEKVGGYKRLADELRQHPEILQNLLREKLNTRVALDGLKNIIGRMPALAEREMQIMSAKSTSRLKYLTNNPDIKAAGPEHMGDMVTLKLLGKAAEEDFIPHRNAIKQALAEGKPVPEEVLKEYPDLLPSPSRPQEVGGGSFNDKVIDARNKLKGGKK